MLARGGPGAEDDDLGDDDGVDTDSLWDTRDWDTREAACPPGTGGHDCGPAGFGSGQPFDVLRPGPVLAGAADRVHAGALRRVSDDELTGMIRAWRRLSSWATARELSAIAEFARRRPDEDPGPGTDSDLARRARARRAAGGPPDAAGQAGTAQAAQPGGANPAAQAAPATPAGGAAGANLSGSGRPRATPATPAGGAAGANSAAQGAPAAAAGPAGGADPAAAGAPAGGRPAAGPGFPEVISPFASYELSLALTLTGRSATAYLDFAVELVSRLPKTLAALEAGQIDIIRARIIAEATHMLSGEHAAAVEDRIFPRAGRQTSGQLRAALARAVLAADPGAARARREQAQRDARVLRWREDAGTAALCGRDLPSADVLAADQRISARARQLRTAGLPARWMSCAPAPTSTCCSAATAPRHSPAASPARRRPRVNPQQAAPQQAAPRQAALQRAALQRAALQRAALQQAAPSRRPPSRRLPGRRPCSGRPCSGRPCSGRPCSGRPRDQQSRNGRPDNGRPSSGRPDNGRPPSGPPPSGPPSSR